MKVEDLPFLISKWKNQLEKEELADNSIKVYLTALDQLTTFLEENNYSDLTEETLLIYKNFLLKKRKDEEIKTSTINTRIIGIDRFLSDINTDLGQFRLKTERVQQKFMVEDRLTLEDLTKLIHRALEIGNLRDAMIMKTLIKTGIRISELSFFTVESVTEALKNQCIPIINKKKERIIIVPQDLCQELLEYSKKNKINAGMIFPNKKGTGITDRAHLTRRLKKIAKECGVNPNYCNPHNFRKLFATTYLDRTNNLVELSDILGHSNLATTRMYLHKSINENSQQISNLFKEI